MTPELQFPLIFEDSEEPIIIRDRHIISKCGVLISAIETDNPDWTTDECIVDVEDAVQVPFPRAAGEFLFAFVRRYIPPEKEKEEPKIEDYKEANEKSLEELKQILEFGNFLECYSFMHTIGFVIAKKLEGKTVEEVAAYLGVTCNPDIPMFDEADGWMQATAELFRNLQR